MQFNLLEWFVRANNGELLVVISLESRVYTFDTNMMNAAEHEFFSAFGRYKLAFFGALAQEVGASQRQ